MYMYIYMHINIHINENEEAIQLAEEEVISVVMDDSEFIYMHDCGSIYF
jgi:hypothetical protein